jgi:3-dehydroquinate dehydratase II
LKVLVIHGPNLNLLGKREPDVYGRVSLKSIDASLKKLAKVQRVRLEIFQSNHEGEIVTRIQEAEGVYGAILMNPAAYTHTSVAIRDAVSAVKTPVVEVHLSNIYSREAFRRESLIAPAAAGQIAGFGAKSYELGLLAAIYLASSGKGK